MSTTDEAYNELTMLFILRFSGRKNVPLANTSVTASTNLLASFV
jgi:hypothetical protein